jgi:hypothetical protein
MAFLKKQEAEGKISLHNASFVNSSKFDKEASASAPHTTQIPGPNIPPNRGQVYTHIHIEPHYYFKPPLPNQPQPPNTTIETNNPNTHRDTQPNFSLSIARPKLDFPNFYGEEPFNWLRQCEKYFSLASVPMENWVPLATLHCSSIAQTWWRSLRTPASYIHWTQFCSMVTNRFSFHSTHSSLEAFHHLKQTTSVSEYIQKFEELMSLIQMDYPGLSETYFVSSFIAGLKDDIKHYLIPHSPQTLCDTYWKAKELEKGILHKKSLMTTSPQYLKPNPNTTATKFPNQNITVHQLNQPPNATNPPKPIPIKPKEPGKCWGCQEPWTPEHKFVCKFRRAVNAMSVDPKNWLAMEQIMEQENHVLLQAENSETDQTQQPQLLFISSHAAQGTSTAATFSVLVNIGGRRGIALIDSGSTDTFMDYTFASKLSYDIISTSSKKVKVARGGYLDSSAMISASSYTIQNVLFTNDFKLLQLRGHNIIFGCD